MLMGRCIPSWANAKAEAWLINSSKDRYNLNGMSIPDSFQRIGTCDDANFVSKSSRSGRRQQMSFYPF